MPFPALGAEGFFFWLAEKAIFEPKWTSLQ
jgi:hypothetical protein